VRAPGPVGVGVHGGVSCEPAGSETVTDSA
jgi:hypothetical protein